MKIKTSELIGPALDWAVAKAEGGIWEPETFNGDVWWIKGVVEKNFRPSTNWSQGGPIIEREFIELVTTNRSNDSAWQAIGRGFGDDAPIAFGPTPLIAAMRCYAASKLGDEVDVPDELQ